jgi:hypothetical protein
VDGKDGDADGKDVNDGDVDGSTCNVIGEEDAEGDGATDLIVEGLSDGLSDGFIVEETCPSSIEGEEDLFEYSTTDDEGLLDI